MQKRLQQIWTALVLSAVLGLVAGYAGTLGEGHENHVAASGNVTCDPPPQQGEWVPIIVQPTDGGGSYTVSSLTGFAWLCSPLSVDDCVTIHDTTSLYLLGFSCITLTPSDCAGDDSAGPETLTFCGNW